MSKQLRALEERLGVRLLQRTTRSVVLTDLGRTYLERSSAILTEIDELESSMRGLQSTPRGLLRVSAPQDFGRAYLCGLVGRFTAAYPELRIDFVLTDRTVGVVEEGFDVVLRIGEMQDSTLAVRRLGVCERVLCAAPAYLERYGIALMPTFLVRDDLKSGALVSLLDDALDADLQVMLLMPHRQQITAKVRAFVDTVAGELDPTAWRR